MKMKMIKATATTTTNITPLIKIVCDGMYVVRALSFFLLILIHFRLRCSCSSYTPVYSFFLFDDDVVHDDDDDGSNR